MLMLFRPWVSLMAVVVVTLMVMSAPGTAMAGTTSTTTMTTPRSRGSDERRLMVTDLRCWCGKDRMGELEVRVAERSECSNRKWKKSRDRDVRGKYPLAAEFVRRVGNGKMRVTWNLRSIPRNKRSKVKDFYVQFSSKSRKSDSLQTRRSDCFLVTGLRKDCRRKVTCKAAYKKRMRGLRVQLAYRYGKGRRESADKDKASNNQYHALKTRVRRKKKQRGLKSCEEWFPLQVAVRAEKRDVHVDYGPFNPFAAKLQIALQNAEGALQYLDNVPPTENKYVFTDVDIGPYNIFFLPIGRKCEGAVYRKARVSVNVTEKEADDIVITNCGDWTPHVSLDVTGNGHDLRVTFTPVNPFADKVHVALYYGNNEAYSRSQEVPGNVTSCTFDDVKPGIYYVSFHPRSSGEKCHNAEYYKPLKSITVKDVPMTTEVAPLACNFWHPKVTLHHDVTSGQIKVDFSPSNNNASEVEVALAENDVILQYQLISVKETNAVFNVTTNDKSTYKALVRPFGCRDCLDYQMFGDPCWPDYVTSDVIRVSMSTMERLAMDSGNPPSPSAALGGPNSSGNETWVTEAPDNVTTVRTVGRRSVSSDPTTWPSTLTLTSAVTAVGVAAAVLAWIVRGRCCRAKTGGCCTRSGPLRSDAESHHPRDTGPEPHDPLAPEEAPPLQQQQEQQAERGIVPLRSASSSVRFLEEYTLINETSPKRLFTDGEEQSDPDVNFDAEEEEDATTPKRMLYYESSAVVARDDIGRSLYCDRPDSSLLVFVVYVGDDLARGDRDTLSHLTDVLASLSSKQRGAVKVKADFWCHGGGQKSRRDVREWAERVLHVSTHVVLVLSHSAVNVCASYLSGRSRGPEATAGRSACRDIAPVVLSRLAASPGGFRRAVFVDMGLDNAQQQLHNLMALYRAPASLGLTSGGLTSPVCDSGLPVSTLPLHPPATSLPLSPDACQASRGFSGADASSFVAHHYRPESLGGTQPLLSREGPFAADRPEPSVDPEGEVWVCRQETACRQRWYSEPSERRLSCQQRDLMPRGRHSSAPQQCHRGARCLQLFLPPESQPPPYDKIYLDTPVPFSPLCRSPEHSVIPWNQTVGSFYHSSDQSCSRGHCLNNSHPAFERSGIPYSPPLISRNASTCATAERLRRCCRTAVQNDGRPQRQHARRQDTSLVSLRTEGDLESFLRTFCEDDRVICRILASPSTQSLLRSINSNLTSRRSQEPMQHSWYSSRAGSRNSLGPSEKSCS